MAIPTTRTHEAAEISVSTDLCNGCGICISVCKDYALRLRDGKVQKTDDSIFGCIGCGHCMAVCAQRAIKIHGRTLSPEDLTDLPARQSAADYQSLHNLLIRRRSIREFRDKPVPVEVRDQILDAAVSAPMGLPPSDVNVLVLDNQEKVRLFAEDFCRYLAGMKWLVSDWFLAVMRPFWGKSNDELFRNFIRPLYHSYTSNMKKGVNLVNYDAPLALYFYGSPYADPADPIVAATYAMLAGESLGLGTCMLGGVHPLIQQGRRAKNFRKAQGIHYPSREGLFVIFGYPEVKYRRGIKRTFASVTVK